MLRIITILALLLMISSGCCYCYNNRSLKRIERTIVTLLKENKVNGDFTVKAFEDTLFPNNIKVLLQGDRLRDISGIDKCEYELYAIEVNKTNISDFSPLESMHVHNLILFNTNNIDLSSIQKINLDTLTVINSNIASLTPLENHPTLSVLRITNAPIKSIESLSKLNISELKLDSVAIDDYSKIQYLPKLISLELVATNISGELDLSMLPLEYLTLMDNRKLKSVIVKSKENMYISNIGDEIYTTVKNKDE